MKIKEIFYIKNISDITEDNYDIIDSCLGDFQTLKYNEVRLISVIKGLLEYESSGTEMTSILSGREIASEYLNSEDPNDQFYINTFEKMETENIIIFSYDCFNPEIVVMPEKIGIKTIIGWCAENATNPEIPALCEQLKQKYEVE